MNDIEERIEEQNESLIKELHLFADRVKRADVDRKFDLVDDLATSVSQRFSTLYHQLLSEDIETAFVKLIRISRANNQVVGEKNDNYVTIEQVEEFLTTLNKEKD